MEMRIDADKDTFFANQSMVNWKAARWLKHTVTVEQQRLAVICGYIDDMHLTAVGRDRAFRLLVTFVSVGLQVGPVFAADKITFFSPPYRAGLYRRQGGPPPPTVRWGVGGRGRESFRRGSRAYLGAREGRRPFRRGSRAYLGAREGRRPSDPRPEGAVAVRAGAGTPELSGALVS